MCIIPQMLLSTWVVLVAFLLVLFCVCWSCSRSSVSQTLGFGIMGAVGDEVGVVAAHRLCITAG